MPQHLPKYILFVLLLVVISCGLALLDKPSPIGETPHMIASIEEVMDSARPDQPSLFKTMLAVLLVILTHIFPLLLHQYLLAQVYRYAFQPGEKREWNNLSWVITLPIFICAVAVFALWYNNRAISYVHIVSVMALVFVIVSVGGAVWIGRKRTFSRRFTLLLALAAGLVSLIVPIGAVGVILTWPFVIVGVVGYLYIRYENEHVLGRDYAALTRWQIDSITLAAMATLPLCFLIVLWIASTASPIVSDWLSLIFAFPTLLVLLFSWIMSEGMRFHLRSFSGKKKSGNTNSAPQGFFWHWMGMLFVWGFLSIGMVLLGLFWQGISYSLLTKLVRH